MGTKTGTCTSKLAPLLVVGIDKDGEYRAQFFGVIKELDKCERKNICNILAVGLYAVINEFDKSHKCGVYSEKK